MKTNNEYVLIDNMGTVSSTLNSTSNMSSLASMATVSIVQKFDYENTDIQFELKPEIFGKTIPLGQIKYSHTKLNYKQEESR